MSEGKTKYSVNPLIDQQMRRLDNDKKSVARKKRQFYLTGGTAALGAGALAAGGGAKIVRPAAKAVGRITARTKSDKVSRSSMKLANALKASDKPLEAVAERGTQGATVLGIGSGANWAASLPSETRLEQQRIKAKEKKLKAL